MKKLLHVEFFLGQETPCPEKINKKQQQQKTSNNLK